MRWISVKDKLPKGSYLDNLLCVVKTTYGNSVYVGSYTPADDGKDGYGFAHDGYFEIEDCNMYPAEVTHWMNVPKPPKEDK